MLDRDSQMSHNITLNTHKRHEMFHQTFVHIT